MDKRSRLLKFRRHLPHKGRYGGMKKGVPCPRCGSVLYDFHGRRRKFCPACGFDRHEESVLDWVRHEVRKGRLVSDDTLDRVLGYIAKVYG
jgi:ribosomal protein L37E